MRRFLRILNWVVSFMVPIILVLFSVRILLTPLYIQVEYRLPGFPEDSYGFSIKDRLYWANISLNYLTNREGIEYLAGQELDENTPLYNERELRHMHDVKIVVQSVMVVFYGAVLLVIAVGLWAKVSDQTDEYKMALSRGGWFTVGLIVLILVYLGLNFNSLFTNFHKIFFEGDSWLFRYSDTLIRLFPIKFWRDAFIWIGMMSLTAGAGIGFYVNRQRL